MQFRNAPHAVALASVLLLAACGGGGGDNSSGGAASTSGSSSGTTTQTSQITVQGSAVAVTADPLAVMYMGPNGSSSTLFGSNPMSSSRSAAASSQTAIAGGGYRALNIGSVAVTLTQGTVADVSGTADYQVGRWTNGQGQNVATMSANQGAYYVVGKPLTLVADANGGTFTCSLAGATKPTAVSGTVAPGTLTAATATIDKSTLIATIMLTYSIGADQGATQTKTMSINSFSAGSGAVMVSSVLGSDATKPMLGLIYTLKAPSSGDTSGSAVLSCQ
ncbi:hypothetical protein LBW62_15695 [Ralstonia solanacearum]|uniref:hypothetical protein n=1 Tax=Ralstonia solanacearum TaxID=305 RepID=UPI0005C6C00A|nr:hypothetical protein [Ralstonia solanacearum]MBB6592309.1 hypothetical protein [Ralstonia solanacearum]MBB6596534.1 hypothetical protein [Ralstonia solanacearum]MDB0542629.1 hypothetical protein [Ralstonia solanacearum]MDB0552836.1 hypothetical protein [Ralstonia solanacearum]MDB0557635.1 hypothetical protein [Ralstonia solanacearum]